MDAQQKPFHAWTIGKKIILFTAHISLGDIRLNKRLIRLVEKQSLLDAHALPTKERMQKELRIVCIQDTGVAPGVLDAWMWSRKPKGEADVSESLRWIVLKICDGYLFKFMIINL